MENSDSLMVEPIPATPLTPTGPINVTKPFQWLQGMAFGLRQPVLLCILQASPPQEAELNRLDEAMSAFVSEVFTESVSRESSSIRKLLARINHWHSAIQREQNIPVFDDCHIAIKEGDESGNCLAVFPSAQKAASTAALNWTISTANRILTSGTLTTTEISEIRKALAEAKDRMQSAALGGTNTIHFLRAAFDLRMSAHPLPSGIHCIGLGINSRWIDSSITDQTSFMGVNLAKNKLACASLLAKFGLPAPHHRLAANEEEAVRIAEQLSYPVVVKPMDQEQGRGVFAGLMSEQSLRTAFRNASEISKHILVEKHQDGEDYRFTVMHGQVIKIMHRKPGLVTGDGQHTIEELVAKIQSSDEHLRAFRRTGKMRLELDAEALELLEERGLQPSSILQDGQIVVLRRKSNISSGGSYSLVAVEDVHPDNRDLALRAAAILGLDIAGIDLIMPDVRRSWLDTGAIICEMNAQPQIGYRDTPHIYHDMLHQLVPESGQIPLHLVITEGDGDYAHQAAIAASKDHGCNAFSSARGVWVDGRQSAWNLSNTFVTARAMLLDKRVSSAVVAMTASDILRFGLPAVSFTSIRALADHAKGAQIPMSKTLHTVLGMVKAHTGLALGTNDHDN